MISYLQPKIANQKPPTPNFNAYIYTRTTVSETLKLEKSYSTEAIMASSREICFAVLSFVFVLFAFSEAKDILVGDKNISWNVDSVKPLTQWAENRRFRIGYVLSKFLTFKSPSTFCSYLLKTKMPSQSLTFMLLKLSYSITYDWLGIAFVDWIVIIFE